ncbi:MAG: creatininase family protein [Xanthobacteraceae bacterium]
MIGLPRRRWIEMTTEEFSVLPGDTVAVLPVAAVEQHGPHLPVCVDACINKGIVERTITLLPADLPVTFLPMQAIGKSNEHLAFPGTLSLSADTIIRLWTEIGESVHRAGLRRLVLFNTHGGQPEIMEIVARDLRVRLEMLAVCASSYMFDAPPGTYAEEELTYGIHGGEKETSMMLALAPELVQMHKADDFRPLARELAPDYRYLVSGPRIAFAWQTQDLHPSGACGNARAADAERGTRSLDEAARSLVGLLQEVHRYPLTNLKRRTDPQA